MQLGTPAGSSYGGDQPLAVIDWHHGVGVAMQHQQRSGT
jgi:hypothetical protein